MKNKAAREPLDLLIQTRVCWFQQKRAPHHRVGATERGPRSRGHGAGATESGSRSRGHGVGGHGVGPQSWAAGIRLRS